MWHLQPLPLHLHVWGCAEANLSKQLDVPEQENFAQSHIFVKCIEDRSAISYLSVDNRIIQQKADAEQDLNQGKPADLPLGLAPEVRLVLGQKTERSEKNEEGAQAERSASIKTCGKRYLVCLGNSKSSGRGGGECGKRWWSTEPQGQWRGQEGTGPHRVLKVMRGRDFEWRRQTFPSFIEK